jgi:hypothetical protein
MSTHVTGAGKHSRVRVAFIALAIVVAVFALATQARSIWSTRTGSEVRPVPAHIAVSANPDLGNGGDIAGCRRPKYGCRVPLRTSSHTLIGCRRPKYGCQHSGSTTAGRP